MVSRKREEKVNLAHKEGQIWFSCLKHDGWWEVFFYPVSFSECLPLLCDSIEGERIVLLEYEGATELERLGVSEFEQCTESEAPAIWILPKSELSRFADVYQWDLDWADFATRPTGELLQQVDIRVFDNTLTKYIDLFSQAGSSILFSSHDNDTAYMCVRDYDVAVRFIRHLLTSLLDQVEPPEGRIETPEGLFPELLDRSSDTLIIDKCDTVVAQDQLKLTCWQATSAKTAKAFDVRIERGQPRFSGWEDRRRPDYVRKHIGGFRWGCLLVPGITIVLFMLWKVLL